METLGLEVRRGYVVAAFAERGHRPVLIGDGRRTVIPNAVCRGQWGSTAADHADAAWPDERSARGLSAPHAAEFWTGLRARLRHFLGVTDGTLARIPVVAATGEHPAELRTALTAAGFSTVNVVSPPAAAAHAIPPSGNAESVHRVVCVGDVSAEACTFRVRPAGVKAEGGEYSLAGVGSAYWAAAVVRELDAVRPTHGGWDRLRVWQSVLELSAALNRDPAGHVRTWTGAHAAELVTEVTFRPNCLDRVIEHAHFVTWLDTLRTEGAVERTWTAGLGSTFPIDWPAGFDPMPDPAHAVAVGASLFGHRYAPTPVKVTHPPPKPPPPALPPVPVSHGYAPAEPPPMPLPLLIPMDTSGLPDAPKLPDLPPDWDLLIGGK
jgi:hypothetical protein